MADGPETAVEPTSIRAVTFATAPAWHTAVVVLFLLALVIVSMRVGKDGRVGNTAPRMRAYLVTITAEWLLVVFIGLAARWRGAAMQTIVGENSRGWRMIARDFGLAVAFLVAANTVVIGLSYVVGRLMHPATTDALKALLPRTGLEIAVFLLLSISAGICEEIIFRGYLQRQFTAWTKSVAIGIVVQGTAFGLAHAYQGSAQVLVIAVYGCLFGLLAHWRGTLRPGMVAHLLQDGVGGLVLAKILLK